MSIDNFSSKVKIFLQSEAAHNLYIVLIIILVAFSSFGLGRLSAIEEGKEPISIEYPNLQQGSVYGAFPAVQSTSNDYSEGQTSPSATVGEKSFVASKNSDKYHFPWCSGAKRIKEENKVWFTTREEAKAAGYTPAANCKGL